jgi:hypothetical protein
VPLRELEADVRARRRPRSLGAGLGAATFALEEAGAPRILVGHQRVEVAVLRRRRARAHGQLVIC